MGRRAEDGSSHTSTLTGVTAIANAVSLLGAGVHRGAHLPGLPAEGVRGPCQPARPVAPASAVWVSLSAPQSLCLLPAPPHPTLLREVGPHNSSQGEGMNEVTPERDSIRQCAEVALKAQLVLTHVHRGLEQRRWAGRPAFLSAPLGPV